ncbi:MAG: hypothetical protein AB7S78_02060 [Candidatus Omnitrophota bacterium]
MKNKPATLTAIVEKITWVFLSALFVILFFKPVETGDIWWHLKIGEYIFLNGTVPVIDPFPFSGEKSVWVLTQWLGSLIYYGVYQVFGLVGLQVFRLFLFGLVLWIFIRNISKKIPASGIIFLTFILILALYNRPHLRPFVFNFIFIQVFLNALFSFALTKRASSLFPVFITGPIWVNAHLGYFMYGLSLIGIFLFTSGVELVKSRGNKTSEHEQIRKLLAGYGLALVVFLIMFLFNPYGINGALHPIRTLLFDDYLNFSHLKTTISELQPPNLLLSDYYWFWAVLIIGGYTIYMDRIQRFRNLILILFSFFMFLYGQRAGLFFALVVFYTFSESFQYIKVEQFAFIRKAKVIFLICLCVCLGLMVHSEWQKRIFVDGRIYLPFRLSEDYTSPKPLLERLKRLNIQGAVFNDDSYGGYILWHNYPGVRPFSDTRQINLNNFKLYTLILHDPSRYWNQVDVFNDFRAVLLDANKEVNRKAISFFLTNPEWSLILVKGDQVLFIKKSKNSDEYVQSLLSEEVNIPVYKQTISQTLSSPPRHPIKYIYMEPVSTAITLYELGFKGAALKQMAYSFKISNSPFQHEMASLILDHISR